MIIRASLLSLSSALVMGAAIGQTPSGPIVNGRHLQPTQQQIDSKEDERTRQRNRDGQSDIDRLYEEIMRATVPPGPSPPLAHVGLSEDEAQRQAMPVRVARLAIRGVLRTHTTDKTQGFMKALIGDDDRILGFAMIGSKAGEVMSAVQTAMLAGLPYQPLRDAVIAYLTMAEGLGNLLFNVPPTRTAAASGADRQPGRAA